MPEFNNGASLTFVRSLLNATGLRKNTHSATRIPVASDDSSAGWEVGSRWVYTSVTPAVTYECISNAVGAAVWVSVGSLLQDSAVFCLASVGGTANAITASMPAGATMKNRTMVQFLPSAVNTGAVTITIDGTTYSIQSATNKALTGGEFLVNSPVVLQRITGTAMRIVGASGGEIDALKTGLAAARPTLVTVTNATNAAGRTLAGYTTPNTDIVLNPGSEGGVIIGVPPSKGNLAAVNVRVTVRRRGNAVVMTYFDTANAKKYEMLYVSGAWGAWEDVTPYTPAARTTVAADGLGGTARNFNNMTATDTTWTGNGTALFSNAPPNTANAYITGQWQTFDLGPMLVQRVWLSSLPSYAYYERYYDKTATSWSVWTQPIKVITTGPKLVCFGDSITVGVGVGANDPDGYALRTASLLNATITRLATAGRCMSGTTEGDLIPAIDLAANASVIAAAEVIWIAYGTNDWGQNLPLGVYGDTANGTFYGAMKEGLTKLRALNATAKIAFLTPIYRGKAYSTPLDWSEAGTNTLGLTVEDYRQAIRTFVAKEGLVLSEMSYGSEINAMTASTYLPSDALHPGRLGHRYMSDTLAGRLKTWGWA